MSIEFNSPIDDWPFEAEPEDFAKQELIYCLQQATDDLAEHLHANKYFSKPLDYAKLYELEQRLMKIISKFS